MKKQIINKQKLAFLFFLFPSFLGVAIFVLLPFGDVVRRSFLTAVTGEFRGIENYQIIFTNEAFLLAVKNTLLFMGVCIPLLVVCGLFVAIPLSELQQMQWIKTWYLFPLAIPTATVVLVWKLVFYKQGFLNMMLTEIGKQTGWFLEVRIDYLDTSFSFFVLVASYLWKNLGYTVVLWLAGIMSVSNEIKEAARVDGANKRKSFYYVVLPNLKGSLYTICILSFLNAFKVYREAYLVAGSYPHKNIYLLQHLLNNWFVNLDFDKMAAAAVCTGIFLFFIIRLLQRGWDMHED